MSVQNHYLASYLVALKAILTVQFTTKGHPGRQERRGQAGRDVPHRAGGAWRRGC